VMSKLGLELHPEKTRLVDLRRGKGSFKVDPFVKTVFSLQ